jgi:hypothetical protein
VVWKNGAVVLPARTAEVGPINEALVLLGAIRRDHHDEFDAVGLGRYRSNLAWLLHAPPRMGKTPPGVGTWRAAALLLAMNTVVFVIDMVFGGSSAGAALPVGFHLSG